MKTINHPSFPRQPISFRTAYWLFFISLASVVWVSLSVHLGQNAESRAALDEANRSAWIDQRFTLIALLARPAAWVMEELIFRGFLLQVLRRYVSTGIALLISALAFALEHWAKGAQTMTVAFVVGCYLGWLMIRTNSIYAPIIAHVSLNFGGFYIAFPLLAAAGRLSPGTALYPAWAWPLSAVVIIAGLIVLRREFRSAPASTAGAGAGFATDRLSA